MGQLQGAYAEITKRNVELVAVSTDTQEDALLMLELAGAVFPILADPDHEATRSYGVFDLLGDGVATPSTFVVSLDGSIGWRYVGKDIADRPTIQDILNALDDL